MRDHAWAVAALAVLTALGFVIFPGHTYLQSDTQIYVPILERLNDPTLYDKEIVARYPHVSFTIYDEVSIALRKLTGMRFQHALQLQQIVFRFCALLGVYLIGLAMRFSMSHAVLLAACYGLGATINGPAVLTFEYEPVPRANAMGLTILAFGLVAQGKHMWAAIAAGIAFLYHVPAVWPFWCAYFLLALLPAAPERMRARIRGLIPMAAAVLLLFVFSQLQGGEKQQFFTTIDSLWESAIRTRASYLFVSLWSLHQPWQYLILWIAAILAAWQLRERIPSDFRWLALSCSTLGLLSMPVSYLLLEQYKWSLMPQIQPMRALLYVTAMAVILCASAAIHSASKGAFAAALGWLLITFAPCVQTRTILALFDWNNPIYRQAGFAAVSLAIIVLFALWVSSRWKAGAAGVVAIALCLPYLTPKLSKVTNYPPLHHPELDELARWARDNTSKDALFLFPDAGRNLHPGVFRAEGLRALYVDWKGGGQINFMRDFLPLWQPRWREAAERAFDPSQWTRYRQYGVDYIAVYRKGPAPNAEPVYVNRKYAVYRVP
ncbi:MAG: hypothetical protein HY820_04435 [Acidobacteria bacterium]|nr:hypothetical protein [Acidobacteriota bacterium]